MLGLKLIQVSKSGHSGPGCISSIIIIATRQMTWCIRKCQHHVLGIQNGEALIMGISLLAPGGYGSNFQSIIFKHNIQNSDLSTHHGTALRWMSQNLLNEKSTLVQVMAWCHQATSHYLRQFWLRSMSQLGVTCHNGLTHYWWMFSKYKTIFVLPIIPGYWNGSGNSNPWKHSPCTKRQNCKNILTSNVSL